MPFPARGENVKLGKGSLLLDLNDDDGVPQHLEFVGNATGVSLNWDITQVELYSSTERTAGLVDRARTRAGLTMSAVLNEFTLTNLRLHLLGEEATSNQSSGTSATANLNNVKLDHYYEIGSRQVTNVVVNDGSNNLTVDVDYELNSEFGVIHPLTGGAIDEGDDLLVTFDKPALAFTSVRLGKKSQQIARVVYLADDANSAGAASKDRLELWKVDVAPDGELQLISDEYGSFTLTMAVLTDGANHPSEPYGTMTRVTG
jgi:hypothetical protein